MPVLRHKEFIAKMARYEAAGIWEAYRERHTDDPQCPSLGEETHDAVCKLGEFINLSSIESMRKDLCAKFKADSRSINIWNKDIRRSAVKKAMEASGLRWFELDGNPMIHWCEKP